MRDDHRRLCSAAKVATKTAAPVRGAGACEHLLSYAGESARLFGVGCPSQRVNGVMTAVYECSLHGLCVTSPHGTHLEDESIVRCKVCPDNPANQSAAPRDV